tara:strand:- start:2648 stop:3280 length:633 start_codon:yes stop_codon:yes gene_type:complete
MIKKIQILIDNSKSWMNNYAKDFVQELKEYGYFCSLIDDHKKVLSGDLLIILSCENIFKRLNLNKFNIVVHESDLPIGRGWSPLTHQILEGKNQITVTLFEASETVDNGPYYLKKKISFKGNELVNEIRKKQAEITFNLIKEFLKRYPKIKKKPMIGKGTYYKRRLPEDSEIDIEKSIKKNFNLLRVVDNEKYPAFFYYKGKKFIIKIYN